MDAIESRKSTRNYQKKPLETDVIEKINSYINEPENLIGPYSSLLLSENEIIPAIAAIGYPQENEHLKSWIARKVLNANQRKPEDLLFFYETFEQPLGNRAEVYQKALHNVRLGPSAKNKQPWRILVSGDLSKVHFYIASALADNKAYACGPEYIDIGIAYKHFKIGIDSLGINGALKIDLPKISNPNEYIYITTWCQDS